jgi:hypothetical protein
MPTTAADGSISPMILGVTARRVRGAWSGTDSLKDITSQPAHVPVPVRIHWTPSIVVSGLVCRIQLDAPGGW